MLGRIFNQRRFAYCLVVTFGCAWLLATNASAQTTAFTYQGRLTDGGTPANGNYDLQFALWDSSSGGSQIGATQNLSNINITSGVFAVTLDFGANAFPGASRFLEISARLSGANTTDANNAFFGGSAGASNTTGSANAFFGPGAGASNKTGGGNAFFGIIAGAANTTGVDNAFFGVNAGFQNTTASSNAFFGGDAGLSNTTGGNNTFVGINAGDTNTTGGSNTVVVAFADVASGNLTNAGAIGFEALATQDNSLILGSINGVNGASADTFVGIGTSAPAAKLHVSGGAILLDNNQGLFLKSTAGAQKRVLLGDTSNTLHIGSGGSLGFDQIRFDLGTPGTVLTMLSNGSVGIGATNPDQLLSVNGNASKVGGGSWQVFSDERLKNIRGQFKAGLQTLRQLQPLRYEYKPNNALGLRGEGEYVGFSAQAVQRVLPEAVSRTASGYLQINNDPILWTMLNAIKEQQQEIEQLKRQLRLRGGALGHRPHDLRKAAVRALRKK